MKLAFIRQRYNPFGGAERFLERATTALAHQGAAITVIARDWDKADNAQSGALTLERCSPFYIGRVWRDRSFARAVCEQVAPGRFDLVQSHERIACCDVYRAGDGVHKQWLVNRARARSSVAAWVASLSPYHRYLLAAERRLFASPRLRAVICNSHMVRNEIYRYFRTPSEKLHVIYNGVDLEKFHTGLRSTDRTPLRNALGLNAADYVYLFVGSGFERKGVARLLRAFKRVNQHAIRLIVVGADRKLDAMRREAVSLGIAKRVHFAGGQADVRPFYAAADCFVLPTLYDPLPNAALEALACGLPVITSNQSGAAELVREGESGFVRDALDVSGLADAMVRAQALDPDRTPATARAAVAELGIDQMAQRLLELYGRLLVPTGGSGSR